MAPIHGMPGFFLTAGVVAHACLGTFANPGTWRVLVDGTVTHSWARHHHPNWYPALVDKGVVRADDDRVDGGGAAADGEPPCDQG